MRPVRLRVLVDFYQTFIYYKNHQTQCFYHLSNMYDVNILGFGGRSYGDFYGLFLCVWVQFGSCLDNLAIVLQRCKEKNLALNWEKCHFMVTEGIVLGHKISTTELEVNQAKVSIIRTLMPPTTVKGVRSFLGHVGFYRRFIKYFSKISRPLCRLLEKDANFEFDEACMSAFEDIKARLIIAPIMETPDYV